jgi:hypothetical protein
MLSDEEVFKKVWLIVFKYLYIVMLAVLVFRTGLLFFHGEGDSVSIQSIILGLLIATVGTAFVSAIIAFFSLKFKKQ